MDATVGRRSEAETRRGPGTIIAAIVLWVAVATLDYFQERAGLPLEFALLVAQVLRFFYAYLLVALIAYGLIQRSRVAWFIALVWQALNAGFGLVNLALGGWGWDVIGDLSASFDRFGPGGPSGSYSGPFRVIIAAISFALLLAQPTRRWLEQT